ncbi:VOC family protein [Maribacter sp. 2210JD10-5]|uniref:VOC family protein n=1 Tax=Maribacter sp. 2210JD10-5 TaxID=3386272 RepID=UPI0039BC8784
MILKKVFFIVLLAILGISPGKAQSFNFQFDHFAIVVEDVDKSANFYGNVLKLKEVPHPDKKPGFRWFTVNGNSQVHLIQKEFAPFEKNKSMHLCLATQDLEGVIKHLEAEGITYSDWPGKENSVTLRTDGVKQIYIQDPDDYWIEINTAEH